MNHARFIWKKVSDVDYEYRRCPICNSRYTIINYDNPTRLGRHNGISWGADCEKGHIFQSVKDDRGMWVVYDSEDAK